MYSSHSNKRQSNIAFHISIVSIVIKSDVMLSLKAQSDCSLNVWGGAF